MHLKFYLTCSLCNKILHKPILLPCGDTICQEHLQEKKCLKDNLITCKICKQEFHVKNDDFKSNNLVAKQIEDEIYLTENEKNLKHQIEDSYKVILDLNEQLHEAKLSVDLKCFEHFQEIRRLIDLHREESMLTNENTSDELVKVSLDMIDKAHKMEEAYLKQTESIFNSSDYTSLIRIDSETDIQVFLKETFRHPSLTIQTITFIKDNQEKTITAIKSKVSYFLIIHHSQSKPLKLICFNLKKKS
jgi:hypothetical protein